MELLIYKRSFALNGNESNFIQWIVAFISCSCPFAAIFTIHSFNCDIKMKTVEKTEEKKTVKQQQYRNNCRVWFIFYYSTDLLYIFYSRFHRLFTVQSFSKYFMNRCRPTINKTRTQKNEYLFNGTVERLKSIRSLTITTGQFYSTIRKETKGIANEWMTKKKIIIRSTWTPHSGDGDNSNKKKQSSHMPLWHLVLYTICTEQAHERWNLCAS